MMNPLSNARHKGETVDSYRERRRAVARVMKQHGLGRLVVTATEIVALPIYGVDPDADRAVRDGYIVDLTSGFMASEIVRIDLDDLPVASYAAPARVGRTLGRSYRRYPKGRTRAEWREIERML